IRVIRGRLLLLKTERRPARVAFRTVKNFRLQSLNVLGLPALGSLYDVELHGLAFLQRTESVRLDGGEMHEYILAVLAADEAVALRVVEPLHGTLFHVKHTSLFFDFAESIGEVLQEAGNADAETAHNHYATSTYRIARTKFWLGYFRGPGVCSCY